MQFTSVGWKPAESTGDRYIIMDILSVVMSLEVDMHQAACHTGTGAQKALCHPHSDLLSGKSK